jgi:hypothetical protein
VVLPFLHFNKIEDAVVVTDYFEWHTKNNIYPLKPALLVAGPLPGEKSGKGFGKK